MQRLMGFVGAFLMLMGAGTAVADAEHVSKGMLLSVGPSGVIMFDGNRQLTLEVTETTTILNDAGRPLPLTGLGTGDIVAEECERHSDGRHLAHRIILVRPNWGGLESLEF